jgi:DNA polymerase I-like protein with 3'-5' exonuclease and polymerase domains
VENVIQALARIIVGEQMIKIGEKYRPALTVHDAAVIVAPKAEADQAMEYVMNVMNTPPVWGQSLPVACEAGMGESYGEC